MRWAGVENVVAAGRIFFNTHHVHIKKTVAIDGFASLVQTALINTDNIKL
jgi:hypothetical protein